MRYKKRYMGAVAGLFLSGIGGAVAGYIVGRIFDKNKERYYRILGIKPDSTPQMVKNAYRKLLKRYHPDLHPDADKHLKEYLTDRTILIQKAYREIMH